MMSGLKAQALTAPREFQILSREPGVLPPGFVVLVHGAVLAHPVVPQ